MTDLETNNVERYSGLACFTQLDLAAATAPELSDLSLMLEPGDVVTGLDNPVDMPAVIREYESDLKAVLDHVQGRASLPPGFEFFVPDFWHVAFGRAKSFPKGEGRRLWDAGGLGMAIGRRLFPNMEIRDTRHNAQGALYTGEPPFGIYAPKE